MVTCQREQEQSPRNVGPCEVRHHLQVVSFVLVVAICTLPNMG